MIYRPFHFDYVKDIIKAHFMDATNILVNHFPTRYVLDFADDKNTIINLPGKSMAGTLELKRIKGELKQLALSGKTVNVFIPHTLGVLSNYAFYELAGRYGNIKINVFYEGVIVFYNYEHDYRENLKYYVTRKLMSGVTGIPYKINKHLLPFYDQRIHKIYTPFLTIDAPKEKLVEVKLRQVRYEPQESTCMLIGIMLEDKYKANTHALISAMYEQIEKLGVKTIFYKEHPSDKSDEFYTIAKERSKELTVIRDKAPIENIIADYRPKYIISSWSSALINLSNTLSAEIEIYCVIAENMLDTEEANKLINAYVQQHIKVIYV